MSLLANLVSEDVTLPPPSSIKGKGKERKVPERTEVSKIIAACTGAVVTSLTMTPFDVIKTRLQTQAPLEPLSTLSSASTSRSTSPWPPPIASTSKFTPSSFTSASTIALNRATCCQKTYSSPNVIESLLCKFDPRLSTSSLPASGGHMNSLSSSLRPAAASIHNLAFHPPPLLATSSAALLSSSVCLYPNLHTPTSLPSSAPRHLTGFWDALVNIVRYEGLSAMWRGTGPALAMSVPGQIIYMVGYDWGRRTAFESAPSWAYAPRKAGGRGLRNSEPQLRTTYLTVVPLVAGGVSRTFVAALVSPIELLRTRLQSSTTGTTIPAIFESMRAEGWTSAWRGLPPTLWRDVPFSAIYWAGYEGIKRTLTGGKGMGEGWEDVGAWEEFKIAFVSGAGSGMLAAVLTNPFDVVKTRRQALLSSSNPSSPILTKTFAILSDIAKREGWPGLMRGLTPRLAKVGPACGIMIGCYEALSKSKSSD